MLERGWSRDIHVPEPVHGDGVAGHPVQRRDGPDRAHGLHAPARRGPRGAVPVGLVRPAVGAHGLRAGRRGAVRVRHGRLRHGLARLRRPRRRDARHARRVHAGRRRPQRLLRRQPRRRLQPAHPRGARGQQQQRDDVRGGGLRGRPEHAVPRGAPGRGRRGVPERVRRVRQARVLLQRRVREPKHVPPHGVLAGVQVGLPALLQLRLRRPHQHLHLRRRPRLHHHLLPRRHPKPEVRGWSNGDTDDADDAGSEHVRVSGDAEADRRPSRRRRPRRDAGQQLMARQPSHRRRVGGSDDVKDGNDHGGAARTIHAPVDSIGLDHRKNQSASQSNTNGQAGFWPREKNVARRHGGRPERSETGALPCRCCLDRCSLKQRKKQRKRGPMESCTVGSKSPGKLGNRFDLTKIASRHCKIHHPFFFYFLCLRRCRVQKKYTTGRKDYFTHYVARKL